MITGTVVVNLTLAEDGREQLDVDRRALSVLPVCPDGAHVLIDLGARRYVSHEVAHLVHEHEHRLLLDIRGAHPAAVADLVRGPC